MNEIEKMYENTGIKRRCSLWSRVLEMPTTLVCEGICDNEELCSHCLYGPHKNAYYPLFNVEKQIRLIDWFIKNEDNIKINYDEVDELYYIQTHLKETIMSKSFTEALANLVNIYFEDFIDEEIEEIKEILND